MNQHNELFDFEEDFDQQENESDLETKSSSLYSEVAITATDWTTETVINQINKGNILLNPVFQRRDAWTKSRKSAFIESLILGLPVPQLVLAQAKGTPGQYIVLDGKQRLLALRQFCATSSDLVYTQHKLSNLQVRDDLNGLSYGDLEDSLQHKNDLAAFENQPIRTVIIRNWPSEDYLYHVFLRLNTGSLPLSPQELRQALHPGPFVSFVEEASRDSKAMRDIFGTSKPDFRMRDAELLVRYYAYSLNLSGYSGNLKQLLDETCEMTNKRWDDRKAEVLSLVDDFEHAHKLVMKIFDGNSYRKWSGAKYENRFNRAVFDVMMFNFRDPLVREESNGKERKIETAFRELCSDNATFRDSIEQTTKSVGATRARLRLWHKSLSSVLDCDLPNVPI